MNQTDTEATLTITPCPEGTMSNFYAGFGMMGGIVVENSIYGMASKLCERYKGGCWQMSEAVHEEGRALFVHPIMSDERVTVHSPNGATEEMSAEALGIVACLFVSSSLSFSDKRNMAERCAQWHHEVREAVLSGHPEVKAIIRIID